MNNQLPQLILGDVIVPVPVIQGGMGVGVSRSRLAGAVAKEGGIGVISTAQIGYDEEGFEKKSGGVQPQGNIKKHCAGKRDCRRKRTGRSKYHGGIKALQTAH